MMTTGYNALVEFDKRHPTADEAEQLLELTKHLHASVSQSPRGYLTVRVTLYAEGLVQATMLAVASLQQLAGATAIRADVMTEAEFDARQGFTPVPELLSVTEAADMLGVSRQRVLQMVEERRLPTATKVGSTIVIARSDVEARMHVDEPHASA